MPETIQDLGSGQKWHWYQIMCDLKEQGGISVTIDPASVKPARCRGAFGEIRFFISWVADRFLLLTMSEYSEELVEAFAKVLGYRPFCRYERDEAYTVEWDKHAPATRLAELRKTRGIFDIRELS